MIGVDIIKVERISGVVKKDKNNKVFTKNEVNYAMLKPDKINSDGISPRLNTYAGLYASKEAFLKAIGVGLGKDFLLNEIEISHDDLGMPYILTTPKIKKFLKSLNLNQIYLSISHDSGIAIAVVQII